MQTRSLGVLACVLLIATSCQTSTRSPSPQATTASPGTTVEATATPQANLAAEQILRVSIPEPLSLDPTALGAPEILRALQRPLVDFDQDNKVVPALAERWDISNGGRTLTFHLREARYSNGDRIVAGDFVYSARRLADPRTAAKYAHVMDPVVGGPELLAMAGTDLPSAAEIETALDNLGVSAPDDRTFVVHLHRPAGELLSQMTLWFFVPLQEEWIASPKPTEAGNFVSSGPFVLDAWDHHSRIVLKPNPYWWGDVKPTLTEIQMSITDAASAWLAYEADDLDVVKVPTEDIQRVRSDPLLRAEFSETFDLGLGFYSFNNFQDPRAPSYAEPGPTANKDFRIALIQAIDKQALIDATWAGVGRIANSVVMPGIAGYQPDLNPYPFDLASAKVRMDAALSALGVGSPAELGKLKLRYVSGFDNEPRAAFLAEAWRQAFGLEIEQVGSEFSVFLNERSMGAYDIAQNGWGADYPHAGNQLDGLFTCGGGLNDSQYCNPALDALLARAATEPDQDRQVAIYNEAQTLLMDDAPILPLRFQSTPYAFKPYVSGLAVLPSGNLVPGDYYYETIQILEH